MSFSKKHTLSWMQPWPAWGMYVHIILLAALAFLIACGCWYRLSMGLFFVLFTYVELLDQSNYLNHYYFISLMSLLMYFCPLHRALSIDAWRHPVLHRTTAPAWTLWLLRLQVAIVYVFAGIAKLNPDWLVHVQPLNIWLSAHSDLPLLGRLFSQVWTHEIISWATVAFELTIIPLLLWRCTRAGGYILVVGFHLLTLRLFHIGMFPWIMILAASLFFAPSWPRRWLPGILPAPVLAFPEPHDSLSRARQLGLALAIVYGVVQCLLPLRHHLYPGNVLWTEEGMRFSWRVMLVKKPVMSIFMFVKCVLTPTYR